MPRRTARRSGYASARSRPASDASMPRSSEIPARRAMSRQRWRAPPSARPSAAGWRRDGLSSSSRRRPRSVGTSSGRPRSTSRSSSSAPIAAAVGVPASITMRARRGCSGSELMRRPRSVRRPSASSAPSIVSSERPSLYARSGGVSSHCSPDGSAVPQAASSRASPQRSTWVISGSRYARRVPCSSLDHSRYATPGHWRPARPDRWSAEDRLAATVRSLVMPVPTS
uniref:Unannotated protein n=1 Tax=freshwater metagenome TaxID=449393 RepID=A0A6J7MPX7_9ZZZZ